MNEKLRRIMSVFFLIILIPSLYMFISKTVDNRVSEDAYQGAQEIAKTSFVASTLTPEPTPTPEPDATPKPPKTVWIPAPIEEEDPYMAEMAEINLAELQEVNPEVIGWIRIPDTKIDYPLMQGEDNAYYLKHTWNNKESYSGSIFMECMNDSDMSDFNTIIYGHNMSSGNMFGQLRNFKRESFVEEHPHVYVMVKEGVFRYDIFASYEAEIDSPTYGLSFRQQKTRLNFLTHALTSSELEIGIVPSLTDRILTLSTCTNQSDEESRRVVHARMKMISVTVEE